MNNRLNWDEYFMLSALTAATRASCQYVKSGAVIIKDKRIVASGYNSPPPNIETCCDLGHCRKKASGVSFEEKNTGHCLAIHAEVNAIIQNHEKDISGASMYSVYYPCSDCAKVIAGSGIKELVYLKMYNEPVSKTKEIFDAGDITLRQLDLDKSRSLNSLNTIIEMRKE